MKTFTQWCEQMMGKDLADDIVQTTQQALKSKKDPKADLQKLLQQKASDAQKNQDSHQAAQVANAAAEITAGDYQKTSKPKMKKK